MVKPTICFQVKSFVGCPVVVLHCQVISSKVLNLYISDVQHREPSIVIVLLNCPPIVRPCIGGVRVSPVVHNQVSRSP